MENLNAGNRNSGRRPSPRIEGLLLFVGMVGVGLPAAADDGFGRWVPSSGEPFTLAQQQRLRQNGGDCMEILNKKTSARASVFRADRGDEEGVGEAIDPTFLQCMNGHGWEAVSDAKLEASRVLGGAQDCMLGLETDCAEYVNLYVHGNPLHGLEPKRGIEVGEALCRRGDGEVCVTMSSLYLHANSMAGLDRDPVRALALSTQGCDLQSARACAFAGMLLTMDIDGLPTDEARSRVFLAKACKLGDAQACGPAPAPEGGLPTNARWCRYGLQESTPTLGCRQVDVGWISLPAEQACLQQIEITVDRCSRVYVLAQDTDGTP